ncbi:DUF6519 domain-containing protein [Caballeronia grimmiae]|uniref:DUF6519 domain-containing protein n=1 Tax=Caballeronia grimmiae TaxID=1071679 RepID=UPI0038BB93EF
MAADFSRVRLDPLLDYAGVELKQGGVLLDADANELVGIIDRRLRALASDTLGRARVSSTTPQAFSVSVTAGALQIGAGRLYVDGLLAENHGTASADPAKPRFDDLLAEPAFPDPLDYDAQPYLTGAPKLPASGRHLVYLDVWNREVTHLEQPKLVESAVAVETSSRQQTVWQVRVLADDAGADATCATPDADLPGWAALIASSTGVLSTGTFDVAPTDDPCELPPTGGYRGLENQLYRVEIHDPGQPGGGATFKWSRENASVGSRVASMVSGTELELESLGRDDVLRFNTGDWVEIMDDTREFSQSPGEIRAVTVNDATRRITFTPALPSAMLPGVFPDSQFPRKRNLRVRRWDQKGKVFSAGAGGKPVQVQDLDAPGSTGLIKVPAAGTTLLLENGVTVSFASTGTKGFRSGDWWAFAARTADASVEILDRAPPRGIHHHYARLGLWDVATGAVTNCRPSWPPSGGAQNCGCTQCVTPESHANGDLTIQAAVDQVSATGGTVCLHAGQYVLKEPVRIRGAKSVGITGQGPATVIVAPGTAFLIERSTAVAIDELAVLSLGQAPAISVRTIVGLALRRLALAVIGRGDLREAAIALAGVVLGASISDNVLLAPTGVTAIDSTDEQAPGFLLTAALRIDDNVFLCADSAITLDGPVGHTYETRVTGNQIVGAREVGFSALGVGLPGSCIRVSGNELDVHGAGIRCALSGAWIGENKLRATGDGNRPPQGSAIELATGLDKGGIDEAQVLANQIEGFADAGIAVSAAVADLIVKLNVIAECGNGIVMTESARADAVSIENNHLRGIGLSGNASTAPGAIVGIGVLRAATASVAGNTLRQVGLNAGEGKQVIAGVASFAVQRARIGGNEIAELGPPDDFGGVAAGITIRAPYEEAEASHNYVERDARFITTASDTAWRALDIDEPQVGGNALLSRLGRYTALRVDERRTLVLMGSKAFLLSVDAPVDPETGTALALPGASASVLGNVLIARGRAPAVSIAASGDVLFSDNRCELRGKSGTAAVLLNTPVAVINANRVRGGEESIRVLDPKARVTVIGNITTQSIGAVLTAEMAPLNLIG